MNEANQTCEELEDNQKRELQITRGSTAVFCVVVIVSMLVVLCIIKAYKSFIQRLFLYLLLATLLLEACYVINFFTISQDQSCSAIGLMINWSDNIVMLLYLSTVISTLTLAFISFNSTRFSNISLTRCMRVFYEGLYIFLIVMLPLLFVLIPLILDDYGHDIAWCWIRDSKPNIQYSIGYSVHLFTGTVAVCAMLVITITYFILSASYINVKKLLFQSLMLTVFVLLFEVVANTGLVIRILSRSHENCTGNQYKMWMFYGAIVPLWHLIIPCGFMGSFYFRHFRNICCKKRHRQYDRIEDAKNTIPVSERVTAPSNTFFNVSYTNGFTNVEYSQSVHNGTFV